MGVPTMERLLIICSQKVYSDLDLFKRGMAIELWDERNGNEAISTTRLTGGLFYGYKPLLLASV